MKKSHADLDVILPSGAQRLRTYGDVTVAGIVTSSPHKLLPAYAKQLRSAGWSVDEAHGKPPFVAARKYRRYGEQWLELRPEGKGAQLTLVDYSFPSETIFFEEADTMEVKARKFKGAFELPPPDAGQLGVSDQEDFPFLRHFPGFALRPQLTRHSGGLELHNIQLVPGDVTALLKLDGTSVTKSYRASQGISTYRMFLAYRLALMNAGWAIADVYVDYVSDRPWLLAKHDLPQSTLWAKLDFSSFATDFSVVEVKK